MENITKNHKKIIVISSNLFNLLKNKTDLTKINNSTDLFKILETFNYNYTIMDVSDETGDCDEEEDCMGYLQHIALQYAKHYHVYAALAICVFGMISNLINIIVLTKKELASAPINRILTALAITDIMIMVDYVPFAYYYYIILPDKMNFPYAGAIYVLFHMHFSQVLHTVSICLTIMLAVWRYLAIRYPDRNQILCTTKRCNKGIFLSYTLAILLCTPMYLTFKIGTTSVIEDKKYILYIIELSEMAKKNGYLVLNFWLYAVIIKLLPCFLLTIISIWLIKTLFTAKNRKEKLKGCGSSNNTDERAKMKLERQTRRTTKMLVAILLLFLTTEFPQGIFSLIIGMFGKCIFLKCYQHFGEVMDILALLNGSITFILYCWMNKMFRTTFSRLFAWNVMAVWRPNVNSEACTTK